MQLIQGLQIDISAEELKTLLQGRLTYHRGKAEKYEKQHAELAQVDAALDEEAEAIGKYSNSTDAASAMRRTIKHHRDQSVYYAFMVEHVVAGATYRLDNADLVKLGVRPM